MGKKKAEGGAPAYMGLFTSLMTVLLAFFMLMVAMSSSSQEAGFHHGVGNVENTNGLKGGVGVLSFARAAGDKGILGVAEEEVSNDQFQKQFVSDGDGGVGSTDLDNIQENDKGHYLSIYIPHIFEKGSAKIVKDSALEEYLRKMSTGFIAVKDNILIRSFADDGGSKNESQLLATKRANAIIKYLNSKGIGYERLVGIGYGFDRYFDFSEIEKEIRQNGQASFFYIYRKAN